VWRAPTHRDFAISVGRFRTVTALAMAPEPVEVTVGVHETLGDDEQAFADKVVAALEDFSQRYGQYPWPNLSLAITPDLRGGIEFPTHIMQGSGSIGRTTSHEVAHMFFYSLVGNNQGRDPWLDEGLATYLESEFEQSPVGRIPIDPAGIGLATEPLDFWLAAPGAYFSSVYVQPGDALQQLGPQEAVDCALARFVADNAHRIARNEDFVAAFEPTFPDVVNQLAALGVVLESN